MALIELNGVSRFYGEDETLVKALDNIDLQVEIMQHNAFKNGGTDIHYLEKRLGL